VEHKDQLDLCIEKWKQFDQHALESIGVRDRLLKAEIAIVEMAKEIAIVKSNVLKSAAIGGIIGALIGNASPAIIGEIARLIFKL
jgi:hypothetical protein